MMPINLKTYSKFNLRRRPQLKFNQGSNICQAIPVQFNHGQSNVHYGDDKSSAKRLHQINIKGRMKLLSHYKGAKLSPDNSQKNVNLNITASNLTEQLKTLAGEDKDILDYYLPRINTGLAMKRSRMVSHKTTYVRTDSMRNNEVFLIGSPERSTESSPIVRRMISLGNKNGMHSRKRSLKIFKREGGYYAKNFSFEVREGMSLKPHNVILSEVVRKYSPKKKYSADISFPTLPKGE